MTRKKYITTKKQESVQHQMVRQQHGIQGKNGGLFSENFKTEDTQFDVQIII